jgi:hypothetical protein
MLQASNRNDYQKHKIMFVGSRAWPVCRADNKNVRSSTSSQPYRPPGTVMGLASLLTFRTEDDV